MTTVSADRIALRETEAAKPGARSDGRPSFEPHVRHQESEAQAKQHADDIAHEQTSESVALPGDDRLVTDPLHALPMPSADAVFGQGATIYPQGLAVVGYLSMLPPREGTAGSMVPAGDEQPTNAQLPRPSSQERSASPSPGTAAAADAESQLIGVPGLSFEPGAMGDGVDPTHPAWANAEVSEWLMRRISFTGEGQGATLRLRDYRLAPGDDRALAQRLLAMARANQWPAARIVVNGREIWRRAGAALDAKGTEQ